MTIKGVRDRIQGFPALRSKPQRVAFHEFRLTALETTMNARKFSLGLWAIALVLPLWTPAASAQEFPSKPITMVVGFAAGGARDTAARMSAKKLSDNLGQTVLVDNRAGAGGNIAHQQVALAAPDGYTILLGSVGPLCIAPHLIAKLPYDPQRDLAPLTMGVFSPTCSWCIAAFRRRTWPNSWRSQGKNRGASTMRPP